MTIEKDGIVDEAYKSDDAKLDQEPDGASGSEVQAENIDAYLPSAWKEDESGGDEETNVQIEKEPVVWTREQSRKVLGENADAWVRDAIKLRNAAVSQGFFTKEQMAEVYQFGIQYDPTVVKSMAILQREAESKWADISLDDSDSMKDAQLTRINRDLEEGLTRIISETQARQIRKRGPRRVIG